MAKKIDKNIKQVKESMALKDLPAHLRRLAEMIEKGKAALDDREFDLQSITSFRLLFKYDEYKDIVKTRLIVEGPSEDKTKSDKFHEKTVFIEKKKKKKLPVKKLRKQITEQLEKIRKKLNKDSLPEISDLDLFYRDCQTMTLYTEKFEDYYDDFIKSVKLLHEAVEEKNLANAKSSLERILFIRDEIQRKHDVQIC